MNGIKIDFTEYVLDGLRFSSGFWRNGGIFSFENVVVYRVCKEMYSRNLSAKIISQNQAQKGFESTERNKGEMVKIV